MRVLLDVIGVLTIARCTVLAHWFAGHNLLTSSHHCIPAKWWWVQGRFSQLSVHIHVFAEILKSWLKMFTLLQGLWKYFFRKEEYYIVILGLDNAGKTVKK